MLREKDKQIKKLENTLAELTNLKNQNENQLLEKFSLLLNEKKLKIRDQQRLLANSKIDLAKIEDVVDSRLGNSRSPGSSRKGKRKAAKVASQSDEDSDGFERMEIDSELNTSDREDQQTPARSEGETVSADEMKPALKPMTVMKKVVEGKTKSTPSEASILAMPPKRELPFAMRPSTKPVPAAEDSETESDNDDEL
jgi:hypothetical protein